MIIRPEFVDPNELTQHLVNQYKPSYGRLFSDSMAYGFRTMWWQEKFDELEFDNAAKGETLLKDQYRDSQYYRQNIKWFEGMTVDQARILAENNDRNNYYSALTKNVSGLGSAVQFAGLTTGALPDPLMFVPYFGLARTVMRSAKTLKSAQKASAFLKQRPVMTKVTRSIADGGDLAIGAGVGQYLVKNKRAKFQEQWDANMVLADMALSGVLGGVSIAAFKSMNKRLSKVDADLHSEKLAKTMDDLEMGRTPDLKPHASKGINYANTRMLSTADDTGFIKTFGSKTMDDRVYMKVMDIDQDLTSNGMSKVGLVRETLNTANAHGYDGLFVPDEFFERLQSIKKPEYERLMIEISDSDVSLENVSGGTVIQRVRPDAEDLRWDRVDGQEKFKYNFDEDGQAQTLQQRIAEGVLAFTELPEKALKRIKDIETRAKQTNEKLNIMKKSVRDAAQCIISNG